MKTIAIIDDDVYIGDMLEEFLRREGYDALRAYSGTEAIYLLAQHRPDLILLDLMLPGPSGEKLLPRLKGIPTIVLSAKADISGPGAGKYSGKRLKIFPGRPRCHAHKGRTHTLPKPNL